MDIGVEVIKDGIKVVKDGVEVEDETLTLDVVATATSLEVTGLIIVMVDEGSDGVTLVPTYYWIAI